MKRILWIAVVLAAGSFSASAAGTTDTENQFSLASHETPVLNVAEKRNVAENKDSLNVKSAAFDRGIDRATSCFIPKGYVGTGISFSYKNYDIGNQGGPGFNMLFSMLQGVKANMQTWSVAPFASYFVRDNLSLGLRFDYSRSGFGLGNLNLSVSDGLNLSVKDFNYLKQSYLGAFTTRYYMSLAHSKRFGIFMELRAVGGYGQSETYKWSEILEPGTNNPTGEFEKHGTYQDIYNFELSLVPGLAIFITNNAALEVQVGVLGMDYEKVVQTTNQVNTSSMENSGINFQINLLSISFGISYYFPVYHPKSKR